MRPLYTLLALTLMLAFPPSPPVAGADCIDCHLCPQPTREQPCLPDCTRDLKRPEWKDFGKLHSPKIYVIDALADLYEPVVFDHEQHARMSGMGGSSCRLCHHSNGKHEIESCGSCHPAELQAGEGLDVPGLKTAYHRQCMFCHKEWSHETQCEICHAIKGGELKQPANSGLGNGDAHHKELPRRVEFLTGHEPAPYVTFDHVEHAENYGLSCASCHAEDNCASCHDERNIVSGRHLHDYSNRSTCTQCHQVARCQVCHATESGRVFSHSLTGFPIRSFHARLDCVSCHEEEHSHGRLPHECGGCHGDWGDTDSFDHAGKVGVDLGEDHEGMDCGDCHLDPAFLDTPICGDCHDDDRKADLLR